MSCDCECDIGDYDPPEFLSERIVKARKTHKCCECGCAVEIGSRYEYVAGKWDGGLRVQKTCLPCATIRKDYLTCGFIYGALQEHISECLGFDYLGVE